MGRTAERTPCSAADYLAWERQQETQHELFHGEVFAMAGGSLRHNTLGSRINEALRAGLRSRGCEVFSSDQKVGLAKRYVHPDVTVLCGPSVLEPGTSDVLVNPRGIVEVRSGTTEQCDRGLTQESCQRVPSLTDHVPVSQAEVRVEHLRREAPGVWTYRALGPGDRVALTDGGELDVDGSFAGVFELPGD